MKTKLLFILLLFITVFITSCESNDDPTEEDLCFQGGGVWVQITGTDDYRCDN